MSLKDIWKPPRDTQENIHLWNIFEQSLKDLSKILQRYPKIPWKISILERHPEIPKATQRYPKPPEDLWKYCNYLKRFKAKGLFLIRHLEPQYRCLEPNGEWKCLEHNIDASNPIMTQNYEHFGLNTSVLNPPECAKHDQGGGGPNNGATRFMDCGECVGVGTNLCTMYAISSTCILFALSSIIVIRISPNAWRRKRKWWGLYTAPHSSVGLHWTLGDFPEFTWTPGTFFFGGSTAKLWYQFYLESTWTPGESLDEPTGVSGLQVPDTW